ncbi:MAG: chromosome segregation protein SMC [Candidatus Thermoplasmatota archaeon]
MHLKKVEMSNFKSFGKKLSVPFFPGFTAITGPNGSGKSNIADAILFVLGPRSSKEMRAERLTDLIFNGGKKKKKPAKQCKVSLVFDNQKRRMPINEDEVKLTRIVKRAPLKNDPDNYYSRFYINGKSAKHKDFTNLLQHARISSDGYNIVKQGDVTNIIEMGSVERRKIIDGIAGISDFDRDIDKAEKEKEEVNDNLETIKIILKEVSSQIKQLKKDRDEAYRYKELKDKLYQIKAKISYKKKLDINEQINEIQEQIDSYEKEKEKQNQKAKQIKKEYQQLQKKLEKIEKKIAETGGDEVKEIKEKIDEIREQKIKTEERINYSNEEVKGLQKEREKLKKNLEEIKKDIANQTEKKQKITDKKTEKQKKLEEKENELSKIKNQIAETDDDHLKLTQELMKKREEHQEQQNQLHQLKLEKERHNEKIETLEKQIAELQENKTTYKFEIKDIKWQLKENKKEKKAQAEQIKKIEEKIFEKKKKQAKITEKYKDLENAVRKLQRKKSSLQAEYEAAKSIQSRYNRAVNRILKARNKGEIHGIYGTIAELGKVEEKYKNALEIAAGGRMQSIVVKNDSAASKSIKLLQKENLGRATFLPLNKMGAGKPRGKALMAVKDPKSHGFAIDLIDFEDKYKKAFWYVFGDTIVVETLKDARRLMGGVRLVDLNGSLIESSGAMKGGSKSKSRFSFNKVDKNELQKVTEGLQKAIQLQEKTSEEIDKIKEEIYEYEDKLRCLKNEKGQDKENKELEINQKEFQNKLENIKEDIEQKKQEKTKYKETTEKIEQQIKKYQEKIDQINKFKEEKGKILLKGTKKELAVKSRELKEKVDELQDQLLTQKSEEETIQKKIDILKERKTEIEDKLTAIKKEITEDKDKINECKNERSEYRDKLKALMKVEEQMSGKIKNLTKKRDEIYKKTVTLENDIDKINTRIESYYDLISRAKYRLPTLEESIKELEEELKLYNVEIEGKDLPNVKSLKKSLKVTEENMRELEPVNMRALDEYEHQSERKEEMDKDVKRLKKQKRNLEKVVDEITEKKKERFYEVFEQINKNFESIYSELSDGGQGKIKIEDPDNLFDSGLTIKARPRGKKVLLLSALSGGEKSIASLAFIFAIQRYDPSPFYVLDEVDMFLDGLNAENVARMVKNNADHSQFIMVSLRKIALKEANHVYGVTMRENGISEMVGNLDPEMVGPKGEIKVKQSATIGG